MPSKCMNSTSGRKSVTGNGFGDIEFQKSHFSTVLFIHTTDYLRYLRSERTLFPYPPHLKNITALPCKMHNFFIRLKVCCIPPNVGGSEKSRLWVGVGGSEKNRLWCVANGMSGKQRYSKCSMWPPSARIHAFSLLRHWSTASSTTLCWNSAHVATRRFRNSSVSRIGSGYAWKTTKKMKICAYYKVVRWHYSGVVGKGVAVCFLLR